MIDPLSFLALGIVIGLTASKAATAPSLWTISPAVGLVLIAVLRLFAVRGDTDE